MQAYYVVFEMGNNFHAATPPQKKENKKDLALPKIPQ